MDLFHQRLKHQNNYFLFKIMGNFFFIFFHCLFSVHSCVWLLQCLESKAKVWIWGKLIEINLKICRCDFNVIKLSFFFDIYVCKIKKGFSYWTGNRNCKDKCISHVVWEVCFFNRAVFLMESTLNIIILTKRDDLLLILNVLFN